MSVPVHSYTTYTSTLNWFSVHLYCKLVFCTPKLKPDFQDTSDFLKIPQNKSKSEQLTRIFEVLASYKYNYTTSSREDVVIF